MELGNCQAPTPSRKYTNRLNQSISRINILSTIIFYMLTMKISGRFMLFARIRRDFSDSPTPRFPKHVAVLAGVHNVVFHAIASPRSHIATEQDLEN